MTRCSRRSPARRTHHRSSSFRCRAGRQFRGGCVAVVLGLCLHAAPAGAQEDARRSTLSLAYQYVHEDGINTNIGRAEIGTSDTHTLLLELDYALGRKWNLFASLPFVWKRYNGSAPHHPDQLIVPGVDEPFLDDGHYHTDFQDLVFGASYSLPMSRVQIQPFAFVSVPASDYAVYAHAAVGQHLQKLNVGANISYSPPLSDFYYSFGASRAFVEEPLGVNVDHWQLDAEIGYFLSPRLALRSFVLARQGNGLEFPDDFPPPRNDLHWYEHEGLLAREYAVLGVGTNWWLNDRRRLSVTVLKSIHSMFVHVVDLGVTVGMSHTF